MTDDMTDELAQDTVLDRAHAAMETSPDSEAARMAFYAVLADCELFVLLEEEAEGETLTPRIFGLEEGPAVLAFDSEDRLAACLGEAAPYVALPGRVVAGLLAGEGLALGVNLGVAPSALLLPPEALAWLTETLGAAPVEAEARPVSVQPPMALPAALEQALVLRLGAAAGLAETALLAGVIYDDGRRGQLLAFLGARPEAHAALAKAVAEALAFSGIEAGQIDVAFPEPSDPILAELAAKARRLDLPAPQRPSDPPASAPKGPGMDPERPPILR